MAFAGAGKLTRLPVEPLYRLKRVAVQALFTLHIVVKLVDAGAQSLDGLHGAGFAVVQGIALHGQALQDGPGNSRFLAGRRQRVFGNAARIPSRTRRFPGLARRDQYSLQGGLRLDYGQISLAPAAEQQHSFGLAQLGPDLTVACRLTGLAGQSAKLRGQRLQHIVDPREVDFGGVEPQFRFVPPLIKAGNSRRLFQNPAPRLGFGIDQFGNLALPHQRRAVRPGRGIGEQHLDIARPHIAGVDFVGRSGIAGNPARYLYLVRLVETGRCQPVLVVDHQGHFGEIARRTAGGSCEDHIFHAAAAHRGRPVFAHHPAQRLQQVGLATAVRPDDTRQPLVDHQVGGVHKAFEAIQSQPVETQCRGP